MFYFLSIYIIKYILRHTIIYFVPQVEDPNLTKVQIVKILNTFARRAHEKKYHKVKYLYIFVSIQERDSGLKYFQLFSVMFVATQRCQLAKPTIGTLLKHGLLILSY